VPTFKSYVSDPGYYINARPSDVGNITYQIDSEAAKFILTLGYENEDELPWGLVKPLRVAGLVYTNSQGVTEDDEGIPGLDPSKLPSLSKNDREELLEYLDGRGDIDNDVLEGFRSQIADDKDDAEILAEAIEKRVDESVDVEISRSKSSNGNYGSTTIRIEIEPGFKLPSDTRVISHRIGAASSPGVDEWEVTHNFGEGWQGAAQATEAKIPIMEALDEVSDQFSFDFYPYNKEGTMI
jgi:hypothetical protein